jgi:hypothetical protein
VSFADDIVPLFRRTCSANTACHGNARTYGSADLFLGPPLRSLDGSDLPPPGPEVLIAIHRDLVTPSLHAPSMLRVTPGDPARSFLMHKLDATYGCGRIECTWIDPETNEPSCGGPEPYAGEMLELEPRNLIRRWIAQGALLGFSCDGSSPVHCEDAGGVCCGGRCTVLSSKRDCGRCDNACPDALMQCAGGACVCPDVHLDDLSDECNGRCVEFFRDRENCGACGKRCAPGEYCGEGTCQCRSLECLPSVVCGGRLCTHPYPEERINACCTTEGACGADLTHVQVQGGPLPARACVPVPGPGALDPSCLDLTVGIGASSSVRKGCCAQGACGLMLDGPDLNLGCVALDRGQICGREPPDAGATDAVAD